MPLPLPRVALLSGWYLPDSVGGTEQYVQALAQDLQKLGCAVVVAAPAEQEQRYEHEGITVYRYPVTPTPTRAEVSGDAPPQHLERFEAWLREVAPDVVHLHSFTRGCGLHHAAAVKRQGLPLLFTLHIPGITCMRGTLLHNGRSVCDGVMQPQRCAACTLEGRGLPEPVAHALSRTPDWLIRLLRSQPSRLSTAVGMRAVSAQRSQGVQRLFALADHLVVVAAWLREVLLNNNVAAERITVSRHGLTAAQRPLHPAPRPTERPLRVGYIGRFDPIKGIHVLVEAARQLPSEIPWQLSLYGRCNNEAERTYLRSLQARAQGDPRISFPGELTAANRSAVMASLDLLAIPSLCLETGPLVALEAFAAGIPVLGSRLGGLVELVSEGENGLLLPAGDIPAWRDALHRLARDPSHVQALAQHIPPVRASHEVAREMLALYQTIRAARQ